MNSFVIQSVRAAGNGDDGWLSFRDDWRRGEAAARCVAVPVTGINELILCARLWASVSARGDERRGEYGQAGIDYRRTTAMDAARVGDDRVTWTAMESVRERDNAVSLRAQHRDVILPFVLSRRQNKTQELRTG